MRARVDQVPFAASRALNQAATETREYLINTTWPRGMTVRNASFMRVALWVNRATKQNLRVEIVDRLGRGNLALHASGGNLQARGRSLAIPLRTWVVRGSHGVREDMLLKAVIASATKRSLRITNSGVYIGQSGRLNLRYSFKPSARINKDVAFYSDFETQMKARMKTIFPQALSSAMASAR